MKSFLHTLFVRLCWAFLALLVFPGAESAGVPVTDHPRLLVRSIDLPASRARMNSRHDVSLHVHHRMVATTTLLDDLVPREVRDYAPNAAPGIRFTWLKLDR
jgi:hypothetical protein